MTKMLNSDRATTPTAPGPSAGILMMVNDLERIGIEFIDGLLHTFRLYT